MLREMIRAGVSADLVVGSSVGAMNAAYFAALLMQQESTS